MFIVKIVLPIIFFYSSESARILGIIPTPSYSHQVVFQPLWKELSLRGHQVTVLTTNPINDPTLTNLTEIDLGFSYKYLEENLIEIINSSKNIFKVLDLTSKSFFKVCDKQLEHPQVQELMNNPNEHFDLVIAEFFMVSALYFSRKFNCPFIGVISVDPNGLIYREIGNPTHPILYPDMLTEVYDKPNIFQRTFLVLFELFIYVYLKSMIPLEEELAKKHFHDDTPPELVRRNASLVFVNANPIYDAVRPLVPSVIQIGGKVERISVKPLQTDIKDILDNANEGFIYFSLGSNVKSKDIPRNALNVILQTFEELPYKILWKYELSDLPNKPKNVIISKWVSQQEVLRHPNIKLFITHGGGQSVEEAFSARVPVVGMPFFVDQPYNIKKMVAKGCGLFVDYREMSKEDLKSSILEVIHNPKYWEQIKKLADLAEDQPMTGLERAIWWTEYVIRHKGAPHLRSPLLDIPWYQYYLVDVVSVIAVFIAFVLTLIILCVKMCVRLIRLACRKNVKVKNE